MTPRDRLIRRIHSRARYGLLHTLPDHNEAWTIVPISWRTYHVVCMRSLYGDTELKSRSRAPLSVYTWWTRQPRLYISHYDLRTGQMRTAVHDWFDWEPSWHTLVDRRNGKEYSPRMEGPFPNTHVMRDQQEWNNTRTIH